jgi:hypothetical protein
MRLCPAFLLVAAAVATVARPSTAQTLPEPKERTTSLHGGDDAAPGNRCENKNCNFLCEIYLLNCTCSELKVWVRATLLCYPGVVVNVPAEVCDGKVIVATPCASPWAIWFENIRIGVWDGETCETICVPFKNECCKRRYVVVHDLHGHIRIVEK